ncbi:hypothetical protein SAY86_016150 [Trapa natans]|uniref:Uncharacterized protein n=1 Tax=Trapa natans TaxID=22666 RepID=A0AAN7LFJ9_TRANT|nr:hypothetical protein SAY86_016150 [Trapa natans]
MEGVVFSVVLLLVGITLFVAIHIFIIGRLFETEYGSSISDSSPAQRITDSTPKMSSEDLSRLPCLDHVEGGKGGITITNADCALFLMEKEVATC